MRYVFKSSQKKIIGKEKNNIVLKKLPPLWNPE